MVKALESRNLGNISDADIDSWPVTIEKVLKRYGDANIVVPGHGAHGGTELLSHTLNLLRANSTPIPE